MQVSAEESNDSSVDKFRVVVIVVAVAVAVAVAIVVVVVTVVIFVLVVVAVHIVIAVFTNLRAPRLSVPMLLRGGLQDDLPVDPNEPVYCICMQVSYGEMGGCDNPYCDNGKPCCYRW